MYRRARMDTAVRKPRQRVTKTDYVMHRHKSRLNVILPGWGEMNTAQKWTVWDLWVALTAHAFFSHLRHDGCPNVHIRIGYACQIRGALLSCL